MNIFRLLLEKIADFNDWLGYHLWSASFARKLIAVTLVVAISITGLLLAGPFKLPWFNNGDEVKAAVQSVGPRFATASGDCVNGSGGTWTNPGNAFSNNGTDATAVVDGSASGPLVCTNYGFTTAMIPTGSTILGVIATVERMSSSTGNGGSSDSLIKLVKGGVASGNHRNTATNYTTSMVAEDHGGSNDLWDNTLTVSDVTASNFGVSFSANKPSAAGAAHTISVDYISITIYFNPPPPVLTQRHYIFEQDDGANVNSNTDNGSADTALTNVKKGERLNARIQVDNTGTGDFSSGQLGLFYDRNDNIWTRVEPGTVKASGGGNCTDTNFDCAELETTGITGSYSSIAVSLSGQAWITYRDASNTDLKLAQYVGSGGTGCTSGVTNWTCTTIDSTNDVGPDTSIAFSPSGQAWVSYYDNTNGDLRVAQYVGSGGTGCAVSSWTCTAVDSTNDVGRYTGIAFNSTGQAWVSYYDVTNTGLRVAQYVGSGGTGCAVSSWTCTAVDSTNLVGQYTSIAFTSSDVAWVSYYDQTNSDLRVAQYVGSGGTGCAVSSWACTTVDSATNTGLFASIGISPSDQIWIAFDDSSTVDLRVAQYVGGGSGTGCASSDWTCTTVDSTNNVGQYTGISFSPLGQPWVSYQDVSNGDIKIAKYVSSGGTGCDVSSWTCSAVDTNGSQYGDITISSSGQAWLSYYDSGNGRLRAAYLKIGSEVIPSYGVSGANGDALTTNAAGTCTGGTTFSNGTWQEGVNVSTATTIGTSKCSEVAFMIDTSQATVGTTYRLALKNKTNNKALSAYSTYPTFTIVSSGSDTIRTSKDFQQALTNCSDTAWGCVNVSSTANSGIQNSIAMSSSGIPWVTYREVNTTLKVAKFVGGGGNCTSTDWSCSTIDSNGSSIQVGNYSRLAFGPDGVAWVTYQEVGASITSLKVAKYVGTGGTGCGGGATDWTCTVVDSIGSNTGMMPSINFDPSGNPWVAYRDITSGDLRLATYVGSGGNCTSTAWNCSSIDTATDDGYASLAFDQNGKAWIAFQDFTNTRLKIAEYVGSGGSCANTAWSCTIVDSQTASTGDDASLAINSDNKPWVAYSDTTTGQIKLAKYVGSGGNCTSTAWNCAAVDNSSGAGDSIDLKIDKHGNKFLAYYSVGSTRLQAARYVDSGGSCVDTSWSCTTVDSSVANTGRYAALALDPSSVPWIAYQNVTNTRLNVAKLHLPSRDNQLRYKLDNRGYTYTGTDDANFDQLAATTFTPLFSFDTKHATNSTSIQPTWIGKSDVAASTNNLKLQVYRFGSTNAWTDLATNTTCTANTDCTITPTAISTNLSEYYEAEGSSYLLHFRVYQVAGTTKTLQSDCFSATTGCGGGGGGGQTDPTNDQRLRGGNWWLNGIRQILNLD